MATDEPQGRGTRERVLAAAGEVFAEVGFHHATVRDICARAGVNIAAVNYHFRDKDGLYGAVLASAHEAAARHHPYDTGQADATTAEDRLRAFVGTFMRRLFDEGRPAWQPKLMAREMVDPTSALDVVVERGIRPHSQLLTAIVRELLGPAASDDAVRLGAISIVGQCLMYLHCRPVVQRLFPDDTYTPERTAERAEHIVRFSIGALDAMRRKAVSGGS